ncbi:hypothetical protein GE118_03785 [Mycoplasma sp. NEAQ87857]|uniref:hypothetical protein n=1 Tax=Mycoplasma sp. NEAQ87857 TaxID=2683967 RepID=UPI001315EED8|nr:hypothetical protein [Mycoplasma sp. NEAQ87857]QGZ97904.1 hypothetical protein GE118_03785 [Mycoplasma sp. NEAQ87857]
MSSQNCAHCNAPITSLDATKCEYCGNIVNYDIQKEKQKKERKSPKAEVVKIINHYYQAPEQTEEIPPISYFLKEIEANTIWFRVWKMFVYMILFAISATVSIVLWQIKSVGYYALIPWFIAIFTGWFFLGNLRKTRRLFIGGTDIIKALGLKHSCRLGTFPAFWGMFITGFFYYITLSSTILIGTGHFPQPIAWPIVCLAITLTLMVVFFILQRITYKRLEKFINQYRD